MKPAGPLLQVAGLIGLLLAQAAWAEDAIRLKTRTIHTAMTGRRALSAARPSGASESQHLLLQFRSYPGPELRAELSRRRIRVLEYVPDSALMVSAQGTPDLEGLEVTWASPLEPADKISPALESELSAAYVVVLYPDVEVSQARQLLQDGGFLVLENVDLLPGQLLVEAEYDRIPSLAAFDEVAYVLPASIDLLAGNHVFGCAGPITEAGPVGAYVAVGRGWPKDPGGGVALKYFFQSLTDKVAENAVRAEVERAFREWMRYANVSLSLGDQPAAARTIAVRFARGAHGDAYAFDGPGGILAHTFYPPPLNPEPLAGDMHLDGDEDWHVGKDLDVFTVTLHEAGHALGLGHSDHPGAVMYPYYRFATGLTDDDIAGIRSLYGEAGPPPVPPVAPPPTTPPKPNPAPPPTTPPNPAPAPADTSPPSIRILSPGSTIVSTSSASIRISGTARDNLAVTAVKWSISTGNAGAATGTATWFADVPLLVGTNAVTIRAYDAAGNSGWRALTIVRR